MKLNKSLFFLLAVAVSVGLSIAVFAATMAAPEGDIVMKAPDSVKSSRPKVVFNHSFHGDFDCAQCHHKWDGQSEDVQACNASGCHEEYENKGVPESYYRAFHSPARDLDHESCMSCHREKSKAGEAAGPTSCAKGNSCHVFE